MPSQELADESFSHNVCFLKFGSMGKFGLIS